MNAPQFTPGPWATNIARLSDGSICVAHVAGERDLVSLAQLSYHGEEQTVANANLMRAAPELYEALRDAANDLQNLATRELEHGSSAEMIRRQAVIQGRANAAFAVLAKARGEAVPA